MKIKSYYLASLAAMFAVVACNKADVESNSGKLLKKMSVTLSIDDKSADSKTSITPNSDEDATLWSVEWQKDDMIGGYSDGVFSPFNMVSMSDGKTATFAGDVTNQDDVRFIYPYSSNSVGGAVCTIDLSSQQTDPYYIASSDNMVMVSEPGADHFKFKTALLNIKIAPKSWLPNSTVSNIEISGKAISSHATLDLSASNSELVGEGNGKISAIPVGDTKFNISRPISLSLVAVPFTLEPGESITVVVRINTEEMYDYERAGDLKYTFIKTNNSSEPMVFGAGMHSTILIDDLGDMGETEPEAVTQFSGDGTAGTPYLISTRADLLNISEMLTADLTASGNSADEAAYENDNNCKGVYFKLTQDIDLKGEKTSIGDSDLGQDFRGVFDGAGHTISSCIKPLFGAGVALDGVVKNLNVEMSATSGSNVAAIALYNRGLIQNCVVSGDIEATSNSAGFVVNNDRGTIADCVNYANVILSGANGGGFVAVVVSANPYTRIVNCANFGKISASSATGGGIFGFSAWKGAQGQPANVILSNCYSAGEIVENKNSPFGGNNNAVFKNCYYSEESLPEGSTFKLASTVKGRTEAFMKSAEFVAELLAGAYSDDPIVESGYSYCAWSNAEGFFPLPLCGVASDQIIEPLPTPVDSWTDKASINYGGGRGTEDFPYMITSGSELAHFATSYDEDCYYRLATDINLAGYVWESVDLNVDYLLDMAGYSISNIYMNGSYDNESIFE